VTLQASVVESSDDDALIRIEVRDTGIGISPSKQAAIFEPFAQADDSVTRVYGGTGLGTTIARQLIGLMGGSIGLESELGAGSLFWLEIRLKTSSPQGVDLSDELATSPKANATAQALSAIQSTKVHRIRGARILVAEDNPTNQRVAQLILESGSHLVTIVSDGEAALDALDEDTFDIALFDLSMPVVSGLQALKLYRFTTTKPIPVLILSANVTPETIAECENAGAAEFIPKPLRASHLLDAIERNLTTERSEAARPAVRPDGPHLAIVDIPIVDMNVLHDLGRLSPDPTFVQRLLDGFRSDTERLVKELTSALSTRRYDAVADVAHALKGGAASVGATHLTQLARRLEESSQETLRLKSAQLIEELLKISHQTLDVLNRYLQPQDVSHGAGDANRRTWH
jgi:two-component system, sensor histidine kinase RpfC